MPVAARMVLPSPLGPLTLTTDGTALTAVALPDDPDPAPGVPADPAHPVLDRSATQLREYFAGRRTVFGLPLAPVGTLFQQVVWAALAEVPHGTTVTYGALAARAGSPGAARAVGAAVGRNPLTVVVPCHRVVGANGTLTGYRGGLDRKRTLLALEQLRGTAVRD